MGVHPQINFARVTVLLLASATALYLNSQIADPFNLPKLAILIAAAGLGLTVFALLPQVRKALPLYALLAVGPFIAVMIVAALVGPASPYRALWGTAGRQTGLMAYVGLAAIAMLAAAAIRLSNVRTFFHAAIVVTGVVAFYGLIQDLGADPIKWNNPYNPIIGTFGNPNFAAAFLGINAVLLLGVLFLADESLLWRAGAAAVLLVSIWVTWKSDAAQGLAALAAGGAVVVGVLLHQAQGTMRRLFIPYAVTTPIVGFVGLLGTVGVGPLGSLLTQQSVTYRQDYWLAGIRMLNENPLFGVGLDSYGDGYRSSRTMEAALRRGPQVVSDSAHNVAIQFGATGGYPLLIAFALFVLVVSWAAIRSMKHSVSRSAAIMASAVTGAWLAFFLQAMVSIDQLGLAVWGWLIAGVALGMGFGTEHAKYKAKVNPLPTMQFASLLVALATLFVSMPLLSADRTMREVKAIGAGSNLPTPVIKPEWLSNARYAGDVVLMYSRLGQNEQLLATLREGLARNPQDFLLQLSATEAFSVLGAHEEAIKAGNAVTQQDPYNQNAWLLYGNALLNAGKTTEAKAAYEQGLAIPAASEDAKKIREALAKLQASS